MKPCYALLSGGSYVALHHAHWLSVIATDGAPTPGFEVVCGAPGQDDLHYLYTWNAYPQPHESGIVWKGGKWQDGEPLTNNEVAANEMLSRFMAYLAADKGGLIDIDDLAADIVAEMGLEAAA